MSANTMRVIDGFLTPLGYVQYTNLAAPITIVFPNGAVFAFIQAEAQNVRYRDDGVAPTTTVGMVLAAGATLEYNGAVNGTNMLEFIGTVAGAKLNVSFYGTL